MTDAFHAVLVLPVISNTVYTAYCYQIDPSVVEVSVSGMCNYIPGMLPAQCRVCVQEASESIIKLAQSLTIKESKTGFFEV